MSDDREKLGLSLCPFCGGAARFGKCAPGEQEAENDGAEYIECCDCGASTCLVFPLMDSAKQVLRDMWNRRTDAHHEPANTADRRSVETSTTAAADSTPERRRLNATLTGEDKRSLTESSERSERG